MYFHVSSIKYQKIVEYSRHNFPEPKVTSSKIASFVRPTQKDSSFIVINHKEKGVNPHI